MPIENDQGQVALAYYQPIQKYVQVGQHEYVFVPKAHISMAWIDPVDVGNILSLRRTDCACSAGNPIFRYANDTDVIRWTDG